MSDNHYWLLPEGVSEALPHDANQLEALRRELIDLYRSWGYQLVMPPLVEFMESLSTGTGKQLDIQTFKLTDQASGRLMGVRADITPQVARIDAHRMRVDHPNRLCYMGPVLRTRSNHANGGSRSPLQIGAELFGHAGLDSDFEVISLAIETLQHCAQKGSSNKAKQEKVILDLGHVGIFTEITNALDLNEADQEILSDMLERKSVPDISDWIIEKDFADHHAKILQALPELNGKIDVIDDALELLSEIGESAQSILDNMRILVERLQKAFPDIVINLDFGELRGYAYHTGIMFQLYLPSVQRELIRGGRYDGIGEAFGNARPATGFSADLRWLNRLSDSQLIEQNKILAPASNSEKLDDLVKQLRAQGDVVIRQLASEDSEHVVTAENLGCNYQIVNKDNDWVVAEV